MKPTEITTGLWSLNPPPCLPPPQEMYASSIEPYQNMRITLGGGQVVPGNLNKELLGSFVYSTNQLRFEAQQHHQQWNMTAYALFQCVTAIASKMDAMMKEVAEIRKARTFVVPLTTLAHEPLRMRLNIPATIEGYGEEFTATFSEANVSASGETEADAIANLKESLVSTFEFLESLPENELGPLPARQWGVLRNVLTR
jgi:predicted RNase H-like HicB family nuclease